ncbi:MAG: competence/damage-inducible protein A [Clostridium sp.]|nr:competence/damage-inducible protein A [Clostridium sp.]
MRAEILSVGTELLLGDILNTNARYIARELAAIGVNVYYQTVVGDNPERLKKAYHEAVNRADVVITTGGLGPTKDDLTKEIAAEYFNKKLILDQKSMDKMLTYFKNINRKPTENNKKQAYFPEGCTIIKNDNGTAPGCIIQEDNKIVILLPGPPKEMKPMFDESVIPFLEKFQNGVLVSKVLRVSGIGESSVDSAIGYIFDRENPTVAPYAKDNEVHLRITAKGKEKDEAEKMIAPVEKEIRKVLNDINVYGVNDETMEDVVARMLIENKLTISTAESCTGGLLAGRIINYPGISEVFMDGAVTYSNSAKMRMLGVTKDTLNKFGAVSSECAGEMAYGIAKASGTDIGVSTTGLAGPGGGSSEKPVGLVYMGIYIKGKVITKKFNFAGNRQKIRDRAAYSALDFLRRAIIQIV